LYFVKAKWPRDWITTAEGILREQWIKNYKPSMGPNPTETAVCCLLDLTIIFLNQRQAPSSSKGYFAELDAFTSDATTGDALDEWLSSPPLGTVGDPIGWWTAMETAGHPLARMSLDFLSTPGTMHCIAAHGKMLMLFVSHIHRL
jgi:hypothetical protein